MPLKHLPLYQGRDWRTFRWLIAEILEALDRMHDLCVAQDLPQEQMAVADQPLLLILYDCAIDIAASITTACAETIQQNTRMGTLQQRWLFVELQFWADMLIEQIAGLENNRPPNFEETTLIIAEIKRRLGAIDT